MVILMTKNNEELLEYLNEDIKKIAEKEEFEYIELKANKEKIKIIIKLK